MMTRDLRPMTTREFLDLTDSMLDTLETIARELQVSMAELTLELDGLQSQDRERIAMRLLERD